MPKECHHLTVRLQIEQQRFLNFALESGLLYADTTLCSQLQVNRSLLLAVLAEIKNAFEECVKTNGKYTKYSSPSVNTVDEHRELETDLTQLLCAPPEYSQISNQQDETNFKKIRKFGKGIVQSGKNFRTIVVEPKRLIWATLDKAHFEGLLNRLADLNSFLIALLDGSQTKRLQHAMDVSYQEILQIRNDITSLTGLLEALKIERQTNTNGPDSADNPITKSAVEESKAQEGQRRYFQKLTRIKIQLSRLGGQDGDTVLSTEMELDLKYFKMEDVQEEDEKFMGRINATYKDRPVWIEWKDIQFFPLSIDKAMDEKQEKVENRIGLLTELLCGEKPEGFHSPTCLGYVKANIEDELRYGIVFEKTTSGDVSTIQISTLHEMLQERPKPSLSARMSLCKSVAECLHSFHAVNWLHKGLRSENVLFFKPKGGQVDLCHPYVTGFELSRPIDIEGLTERPGFSPSQDIYRHPLAQSMQGGGKYRKAYDIYSLGIILIEIANWKGIDMLLGFDKISSAKPRELRDVHKRLLEEPVHLQRIGSKFGDTFRDAVKVCLTSDESDKEIEKGESEAFIAMHLQRKLQEDVVRTLRNIEAATRVGK